MKSNKLTGHDREAPHSHLIQGLSPVLFILIAVLDGWVLRWSTQLNDVVPLLVRGIFCGIFLSIALGLMYLSHKALFSNHEPSDHLITNGILKRVRNPMYLGIMCIYVAFLCLSISFISLGAFLIIFWIYNRMVQYEEQVLEGLFGEAFVEYKKHVSRWMLKL